MEIRKTVVVIEEILGEAGIALPQSIRRAAAIAVLRNPFASTYAEDLQELVEIGAELGAMLGAMAVQSLGVVQSEVDSYGKGAIVGSAGELEHAAAILHPKLGAPFREAVGGGKAIIPSANKMGAMGTTLDIPLHYKDAAFVRSHFDAMTVGVNDAPRPDEILVALVVTRGGRPLPRIGGLQKGEAKREDGLR